METNFAIIAALTTVSSIAAMSLRNSIHAALSLAVSLAGLAALYLQLDAQFVGFAQILVYVGAVAILVVFAILLTRSEATSEAPRSRSWIFGVGLAVVIFGVLVKALMSSSITLRLSPERPGPTVKDIGNQLMTRYVVPLELTALLLTAALIGAAIIALHETAKKTGDAASQSPSGPGPKPETTHP